MFRYLRLLVLLFVAELVGSLWVWATAPTDTVRVWYRTYSQLESGRVVCWLAVAGALGVCVGLVVLVAGRRGRKLAESPAGLGLLGLVSETASSALYWLSHQSRDLRGLFQSVWAWHRVPTEEERGFRSFLLYAWAHFLPWALVLMIGVLFCIVWSRVSAKHRIPT
jgi:hypothetical protein